MLLFSFTIGGFIRSRGGCLLAARPQTPSDSSNHSTSPMGGGCLMPSAMSLGRDNGIARRLRTRHASIISGFRSWHFTSSTTWVVNRKSLLVATGSRPTSPHEIDERTQLRLRLASAGAVEVEPLGGEKIGPQYRAQHARRQFPLRDDVRGIGK